MYTKTIEKPKILLTELNGEVVEYTTDGGLICESVENILAFIEANHLNVENVWTGNVSWDGDPRYDEYQDMEVITSREYFDSKFDEITAIYFKYILTVQS